ncbi:HU family DNA-binding protein [Halorubellus litoreus]|uniref:HU family DNA-binding protein n=1 Tax=Halorubellus litoreus TaxID=755308 RepID=A0ABD5VEY5_9EURY
MKHDTIDQDSVSRRTVLRRGVGAAVVLGFGLPAATGQVAAGERPELVEAIATESGLSKADSKRALDGFVAATTKALKKGDRLAWRGFGSFSISKRSARTGRNPQTGKRTGGATTNVVGFRCGDELAAALDLVPGAGDERRHRARRKRRRGRDGSCDPVDGCPIDADDLAAEARLSPEAARAFLDAFPVAAATVLKRDGTLSLPGFGAFSISKRSARTGRNPQTGKEIQIAAKNVVKFKAGAELSKAVN